MLTSLSGLLVMAAVYLIGFRHGRRPASITKDDRLRLIMSGIDSLLALGLIWMVVEIGWPAIPLFMLIIFLTAVCTAIIRQTAAR